ncbi:MAG: hypothetical protein AB1938_06970 [Myxococcota bacterium]
MRPLRVTCVTGASWVLALLLIACDRPAPPRDLPETGTLLARVTDTSGAPVPAALFAGRGAFTDTDGIATGVLLDTGGGFTRLEAPGYATTWTQPLPGEVGGKQVLVARLSPVEAVVEVHPDTHRSLSLGPRSTPDLLLDVPPGAFPLPATVSVARVRAQDLGPVAFAPREEGLGETLQRAVWLDGAIEGVPAPTFAPLRLTVRHPERFGPTTLGRFEASTGAWRLAPQACTRGGARASSDHVRCEVAALGLWAFFGEARPDPTGDGFVDAEYALRHELSLGVGSDSLVSAAAFAHTARAFALTHPDIGGLHALLAGAAVAHFAGEAALTRELLGRALPLVAERVKAEDGADCGRVVELLHTRELGNAVGLTRAQRRTLAERLDMNQWSCDVWAGWVHAVLVPDETLGDDAQAWQSGASWSERHGVRLTVDEFSGVRGATRAAVRLPLATYLDDTDGPQSCGDDFREVSFGGRPEVGEVRLSLEGSVAADVWTLRTTATDARAAPEVVMTERAQRWLEGGDACLLVEDTSTTRTVLSAWTSLWSQGAGVPLSMAEMLSDGARAANPLGAGLDDRHGFARVRLPKGGEARPFSAARVEWRFFQVTPRHAE